MSRTGRNFRTGRYFNVGKSRAWILLSDQLVIGQAYRVIPAAESPQPARQMLISIGQTTQHDSRAGRDQESCATRIH
jgi:hypothetical protein